MPRVHRRPSHLRLLPVYRRRAFWSPLLSPRPSLRQHLLSCLLKLLLTGLSDQRLFRQRRRRLYPPLNRRPHPRTSLVSPLQSLPWSLRFRQLSGGSPPRLFRLCCRRCHPRSLLRRLIHPRCQLLSPRRSQPLCRRTGSVFRRPSRQRSPQMRPLCRPLWFPLTPGGHRRHCPVLNRLTSPQLFLRMNQPTCSVDRLPSRLLLRQTRQL